MSYLNHKKSMELQFLTVSGWNCFVCKTCWLSPLKWILFLSLFFVSTFLWFLKWFHYLLPCLFQTFLSDAVVHSKQINLSAFFPPHSMQNIFFVWPWVGSVVQCTFIHTLEQGAIGTVFHLRRQRNQSLALSHFILLKERFYAFEDDCSPFLCLN